MTHPKSGRGPSRGCWTIRHLLMEAAASLWQRRPEHLKSLIGSLTYASAGWQMLRALAGQPDLRVQHGPAAVIASMVAELHGRPMRRGAAGVPLRVPDNGRSEAGGLC